MELRSANRRVLFAIKKTPALYLFERAKREANLATRQGDHSVMLKHGYTSDIRHEDRINVSTSPLYKVSKHKA